MTESETSFATFVTGLLSDHKTSITGAAAGASAALGAAGLLDLISKGMSLLAVGAAVICTLMLARYHRANERKMSAERDLLIAERELLDIQIQREKAQIPKE